MGCRLIRGETIYFVRQGGRTSADLETDWFREGVDFHLLPPVYTRSDGHAAEFGQHGVVPIEVRTFEGS